MWNFLVIVTYLQVTKDNRYKKKKKCQLKTVREKLYKIYKHGINLTGGLDTVLASAGVIKGSDGLAIPLSFPLHIAMIVCGSTRVRVDLARHLALFNNVLNFCDQLTPRKLVTKVQNIIK